MREFDWRDGYRDAPWDEPIDAPVAPNGQSGRPSALDDLVAEWVTLHDGGLDAG